MNEVLRSTALEQAALIRSRHISSEELVRATLERIDARNYQLNAFVTVFHSRALRAAREKDAAVRRGDALPPFHGVPIGIKDLNFVRFARARMGSRAFLPLVSPVDDKSVASMRRGGFVIVGKTATSELGAMPVTEPDVHPPTRNPWDLDRSPGGSSGGAASAVAAHLLAVAQGSDGGGSVRLPSAFCNLYGFKPSRGRVANAFGLPDRDILYTSGPITHSVEDAAVMLDLFANLDLKAPHWAPPPERLYRESFARTPRALRIRFARHNSIATTAPEIVAALEQVAKRLAEEGHQVDEGELPGCSIEEFLPVWQQLIGSLPLMRWSKAQPITRWLREGGKHLDAARVLALRHQLAERFLAAFDEVDVWLTPTTPAVAPKIGAFVGKPPEQGFHEAAPIGSFTALFNVTGQPAASVPMGLTAAGLPMGVQLVGQPYADDVVLALSRQLEQLMPWRHRLAPFAAS